MHKKLNHQCTIYGKRLHLSSFGMPLVTLAHKYYLMLNYDNYLFQYVFSTDLVCL